jgi:hypothetical protein
MGSRLEPIEDVRDNLAEILDAGHPVIATDPRDAAETGATRS